MTLLDNSLKRWASGSAGKNRYLLRIGLVVSITIFIGGLVISFRQNPSLLVDIQSSWWLLVMILVPCTISLNALQFWYSALFLNLNMPLRNAFTISVLSRAANMLPLPGGSIVRILALKTDSTRYRDGVFVTFLVAMTWIAVTIFIGGLALLLLEKHMLVAIIISVSGVLLAALSLVTLRILIKAGAISLFILTIVQLLLVNIGIARIWACFRTVGTDIEPYHAAVINMSGIIAALIGLAPGGLGITETAASAIAYYISISASAAFVAVSINRISNYLVIVPLAAILSRIMNQTDEKSSK